MWDRLVARRVEFGILGIAALSILLRCAHLFNSHNYYIWSADSYFFHWAAQGVMAGEPPLVPPDTGVPYALHSGMVYPLAYMAKGIGSATGMSSAQALELVSKSLPPFLGLLTLVVVWLVAARLWNRRAALFSALAWALMWHTVVIGASGYLDRDGISSLLLLAGAVLFLVSDRWHIRVRGRNIGWLVAGILVLGFEVLLYLEWGTVGALLLLVVPLSYVVVRFVLELAFRDKRERETGSGVRAALQQVGWRALAIVILGNVVLAAAWHGLASASLASLAEYVLGGGQSAVGELQGLGLGDILLYQLFVVPIVVGLYVAFRSRNGGALLFSCWFLCFLFLGLFARRVLFYATAPAALLSGIGLAVLWDWARLGQGQTQKKIGVALLLCLVVLISAAGIHSLGSNPVVAVDEEWQQALQYIKEDTPEGSVVMTVWSWGYWILDLGDRRPVVDNGYYGSPPDKLHDVGVAYATTEPSETAQMMERNGADYLIFSDLDLRVAEAILGWAEPGEKRDKFSDDSMVVRCLDGRFESGGGLEVVYRTEPDSEVVVLHLVSGAAQ